MSLADDAGVTVSGDARHLSEFAAVVYTLTAELLEQHPRVESWRVLIVDGEVELSVIYLTRSGPAQGSARWTLAGILNDGADAAVRVLHTIRTALDEVAPSFEAFCEAWEAINGAWDMVVIHVR